MRVITEIYGFSASRRTIWLALCFNLTFTVLMYFIMMLPEGEDWQEKEAFEVIFVNCNYLLPPYCNELLTP